MAFKGILPTLKEIVIGPPATGGIINNLLAPKLYSRSELLNYFTGYVYASVMPIAEEVGKVEFAVARIDRRTGKREMYPQHPFLKLLRNPTARVSKYQLLEGSTAYLLMMGECFWYAPRGENTNLPLQLIPLRPDAVESVVDNETGELLGWQYNNGRGERIPFELPEIIQIKTFNPADTYRGYGALQAAMDYVMVDKYSTDFTKNYLYNNASPGGLLTVKTSITKDAWEKLKTEFRQAYQGLGNSGKTLLLQEAEADFKKIGANLSEVGLDTIKELSSERILHMFRVPKQILGIPDNINLATSQVLERTFAKRTVEPQIFRIEDGLQNLMDEYAAASNKGRVNKIDYELTHESIVPEDRTSVLAEYREGLKTGYMTINEVREKEGLPPIDGGDEVRMPANYLPVGSPMAPQARGQDEITVKRVVKRKKSLVSLTEFDAYRRQKWESINDAAVGYEKAMDKYLNRQKESLLSRLTGKGWAKAFEEVLFDTEEEAAAFVLAVGPVFQKLADKQYGLGQELVGGDTDPTHHLREFVNERVKLLAPRLAVSMHQKLESVLVQAAQEGATVADTRKRITDFYGGIKDHRAEVIARTELNAIANRAAVDAYRAAGVSYKVWFANQQACEFCRIQDGKIVGIDTAFADLGSVTEGSDGGRLKIDYATVGEPPLHPNCRCDVVPQNDFATPFGKLPSLESREEYDAIPV